MEVLCKFNEEKIDIVKALSKYPKVKNLSIGYEGPRGPIKHSCNITTVYPVLRELTLINVQLKEDDLTAIFKQLPNLNNVKLEKCSIAKTQDPNQACLNFEGCTLKFLQVVKCKLYSSKLEKTKNISRFVFDLDCKDEYLVRLNSKLGTSMEGETTVEDDLFVYTPNTNNTSNTPITLKIRLYLLKRFECKTNASEYLSIYPAGASSTSSSAEDTEKESEDVINDFDTPPEFTSKETDSSFLFVMEAEKQKEVGATIAPVTSSKWIFPEEEEQEAEREEAIIDPAIEEESAPPPEQDDFQSADEIENNSHDSVSIIRPTITKYIKKAKSRKGKPIKPELSESEYEEESSLSSSSSSSSSSEPSSNYDYNSFYHKARSTRQLKRPRGRPPLKKRRREPTPLSSSSEDSDLEIQDEYYQQKELIAEVVANCRKFRAVIRIKDTKKRRYISPFQ